MTPVKSVALGLKFARNYSRSLESTRSAILALSQLSYDPRSGGMGINSELTCQAADWISIELAELGALSVA
jgi:hypothetical protein